MAKKNNVPDAVVDILKECGVDPRQSVWDCHGTWVVLHKALEIVAVNRGIVFDLPIIIEASSENKTVALTVQGHMGERREWSIGEAAPSNNKNSYPYAMAEKRAKDRVILKLVGLHGYVYSEEEADDFKESLKKQDFNSNVSTREPEPEKTAKPAQETKKKEATNNDVANWSGQQIADFGMRIRETLKQLNTAEDVANFQTEMMPQVQDLFAREQPKVTAVADKIMGLFVQRYEELKEPADA